MTGDRKAKTIGDFSTGIPYVPSVTSGKIANARKRLRIRDKEADIRLMQIENDRLRLALDEEREQRLNEARDRARAAALDIMPPDEVMSRLSRIAREAESQEIEAKVLSKLGDIYVLAKRDHGGDDRATRMIGLAGASDDVLDAALNRGVVSQ